MHCIWKFLICLSSVMGWQRGCCGHHRHWQPCADPVLLCTSHYNRKTRNAILLVIQTGIGICVWLAKLRKNASVFPSTVQWLCVTPKHMWKLQFKLNAHLLKLNVYSILVNSSYSMHSVITRYSSLGEMYCGGSPFIGAPSLVPLWTKLTLCKLTANYVSSL